MKREQFAKQGFTSNMYTTYKGHEYWVASVNFDEDLIGLANDKNNDNDDLLWVRCESIDELRVGKQKCMNNFSIELNISINE